MHERNARHFTWAMPVLGTKVEDAIGKLSKGHTHMFRMHQGMHRCCAGHKGGGHHWEAV